MGTELHVEFHRLSRAVQPVRSRCKVIPLRAVVTAAALANPVWLHPAAAERIDAALGDALGASYWDELKQIESTVPAGERAVQTRAIEQRYREPALAHLHAALAAYADHRIAPIQRVLHHVDSELP